MKTLVFSDGFVASTGYNLVCEHYDSKEKIKKVVSFLGGRELPENPLNSYVRIHMDAATQIPNSTPRARAAFIASAANRYESDFRFARAFEIVLDQLKARIVATKQYMTLVFDISADARQVDAAVARITAVLECEAVQIS